METRLTVQELGNNVIGAIIVTDNYIGENIYIYWMNSIPSDLRILLKFQRKRFSMTFALL